MARVVMSVVLLVMSIATVVAAVAVLALSVATVAADQRIVRRVLRAPGTPGGGGGDPVTCHQTAANATRAAVATAVTAASDGDTVCIPADSPRSWTTNLTITKGITLRGAGIGQTVIVDDVFKGTAAGNCAGSAQLLTFNVPSPKTFRLAHLTIDGSEPDADRCAPGHVGLTGTSTAFRVDHVRFEQTSVALRIGGALLGVIDHNTFESQDMTSIYVFHNEWGGGSFGDGSWAAATNFGTSDFIFIEDNAFNIVEPISHGAIDSYSGARIVFRYNTASFLGTHGTESTGRERGIRAIEVYGNTFTAVAPAQFTVLFLRSGTAVVHSNTTQGSGGNSYNGIVQFSNYRDGDAFSVWGACDGTGPYDSNDGTVYVSGTHTGGTVSNTLTDSTKNFTTACSGGNCGAGEFAIRNTTQGWGSMIDSVTTTTVTNIGTVFGQNRQWANGNSYQIRKAYPCIDQVGRGQGDTLSGATPTPTGWPKQAQEPVYVWSNTALSGGSNSVGSNHNHIQINRDFYSGTAKPGYSTYTYPHPLTSTP